MRVNSSMCLALVGIAVVSVGCGKRSQRAAPDDAAPPAPELRPPRTSSFDPPLPATVDEPPVPIVDSIEVLDPGKGARSKLRYAPAEPYEVTITAVLHSRELVRSTQTHDVDLPPIRYGLAVSSIAEGAANGARRLNVVGTRAEYTGTGAVAEIADSVLASYRTHVERKRAWIEIDARGVPLDAGVQDTTAAAPHDTLREVKQLYFASVVPLPDTAVGVGARWKVVSRLKRAGVIVKQVATYEFLARKDDELTVKIDLRQVGEPQVLSARGLPVGAVAELIAFVYEARGTVAVDLARPCLVGTLAIDHRVHGRIYIDQRPTDTYTALTGTLAGAPK